MTIKKATPGQMKKIGDVFRGVPREQVQALLRSGFLPILRDANVSDINPDDFRRLCGLKVSEPAFLPVPADGEWLDLTVNHDADPMDVVRASGLNPEGWGFLGPRVTGVKTYRAKLVRIGYVRNIDEARERLDRMCYQMLHGQAREAFKQKYLQPDGKGPIVFGGSLLRGPDGDRCVACLREDADMWHSCFRFADSGFGGGWRWAVAGK